MKNGNELFGFRLKTLRIEYGVSQKQLGIMAEIDEFVASTRINRYEQGVHRADFKIAQKIANCLNAPVSYFYTEEEKLAQLQLRYHRASIKKKNKIIKFIGELCLTSQDKK